MNAPADLAEFQPRAGHLERSPDPAADAASVPASSMPASMSATVIGFASLWLIAIAFWLFSHPYTGITGDANLYIGRALADLDPAGLGRDMAFVYDGQSRFSLFTPLLRVLVATFGTAPTSLALATAAMVVWIFALAVFARQFLDARRASVVILSVALLPAYYGASNTFHYAEVLALPRPFAEALVILALATFVAGRAWLAFLLLIVASALHPIMALAGWAAVGLVLCIEDRRWRIVAVLGTVGVLAAAACGLPLFNRLTMVMDHDLTSFARYQGPHLFPSEWGFEVVGRIVVELTTLIIAASLFDGRRRLVVLAAAAVGVAGLLLQALLGDVFSLVLIIQAQIWRMAWLLAAMGAAMLGVVAVKLWQQGPRAHIVLASLMTAWLVGDAPLPCVVLCVFALTLHFGVLFTATPVSWRHARFAWAGAIAFAVLLTVRYLIGYRALLANIPAEIYVPGEYIWAQDYFAFFIIGAFLLIFAQKPSRWLLVAQSVMAALLLFGAVRFWDMRSPMQKLTDAGAHPPALEALIASRPGEVLWIDGMQEAWFLAGRPQWASRQQGLGTIFSRELTLEWRARMQFLMQQQLAGPGALKNLFSSPSKTFAHVSVEGVRQLCARADAPAWIIDRLVDGQTIPAELRPRYWQPGVPNFELSMEPDTFLWHRVSSFAVLPCAGVRG